RGLKSRRSKYLSALAGCRDICIETITDIEDNKESDNKPAKKAISITNSTNRKALHLMRSPKTKEDSFTTI
ncbi:MAG TPA: hypothetical protein VIW25_10795, partial [Nitrososphaeraceae archaeon]